MLVRRFRAACERGDLDAFLAVLTEDATRVSDGGAEVKAARRPVVGGVRVARFLSKGLGRGPLAFERPVVVLNGAPALALLAAGGWRPSSTSSPAPATGWPSCGWCATRPSSPASAPPSRRRPGRYRSSQTWLIHE